MIGKILCFLGIHKEIKQIIYFKNQSVWPSEKIIAHTFWQICERCRKRLD